MTLKAKIVLGAFVIQMLLIIKVCVVEMLEPVTTADNMYVLQQEDEQSNEPVNIKSHKKTTKKSLKAMVVIATMYNPVTAQCDSDPLITAGNYKINYWKASKHRWIAVSRDLLKYWGGKLKWGDKVKIKSAGHKNGIYTVVDTMNPRFTNRIDFLETSGTKWYKFKNVIMEKV